MVRKMFYHCFPKFYRHTSNVKKKFYNDAFPPLNREMKRLKMFSSAYRSLKFPLRETNCKVLCGFEKLNSKTFPMIMSSFHLLYGEE